MPEILWVTSFNPSMFKATGTYLINTFLQTQTAGRMLLCREGPVTLPRNPKLLNYNLDTDLFLRNWLKTNKDIIPRHLGGMAGPCRCPNGKDPHAKTHKPRCVGYWFNRNASRWFRKIVSLRYALTLDADIIMWVDSDCVFKQSLGAVPLVSMFGEAASVIYLKSADRPAIESGIIGFDLQRDGRRFLELVIKHYQQGLFRAEERWDDGYIFTVMVNKHPEIKTADLASRATGRKEVVPNSPFHSYLTHRKGRHGRELGLMT